MKNQYVGDRRDLEAGERRITRRRHGGRQGPQAADMDVLRDRGLVVENEDAGEAVGVGGHPERDDEDGRRVKRREAEQRKADREREQQHEEAERAPRGSSGISSAVISSPCSSTFSASGRLPGGT